MDGQRGLSPPTALTAVSASLTRVNDVGIATAAVLNANHLGVLPPYVEQMARSGTIGIGMATTNTLSAPVGRETGHGGNQSAGSRGPER